MAVIEATLFSHSLLRTVPLTVVLPTDRHAPGGYPEAFKTLYLLHGVYGDHRDWVDNTPIARWACERDLAVVMPSGDNMFYVDQKASHNLYGEFLTHELVEVTRAMFPLSHHREDTFIGGLSMGGYGALRNGLAAPRTFGAIAAFSSVDAVDCAKSATEKNARFPFLAKEFLSSALGDLDEVPGSDRDVLSLARSAADGVGPRIFMTCGTDDALLSVNRAVSQRLSDLGMDVTYVEGEGSHEWDFWTRSLSAALDWLGLEHKASGLSSGNVGL